MSQYPGSPPPPPPQDPRYGGPPAEPYGNPPPQAPSDPYLGSPPTDPYAPPQDPYYGQPPQDAHAQQQAWYVQQGAAQGAPPARGARRARGGSGGAAIFGILLVLVGVWVLFGDQLDIDLDFREVWPIGAVVLGAIMVVASVIPRRRNHEG